MFCYGGENLALQYQQLPLGQVGLSEMIGNRLPELGIAIIDVTAAVTVVVAAVAVAVCCVWSCCCCCCCR